MRRAYRNKCRDFIRLLSFQRYSDRERPVLYRIRNALINSGWKTIGDIREISDNTLLSLKNLGRGSVAHLRHTLGPTEGTIRSIK